MTKPFVSFADFALIVHPGEAKSTVGTAWILRRSISNLTWIRSNGVGLDEDTLFLKLLSASHTVPLLLFPGPTAINLNQISNEDWKNLVLPDHRPLFFIIDGTWTQAHATLRKSALLRSLPRFTFETTKLSEYGFKNQPHPSCLSSVEGVHRVLEILASRGWSSNSLGRDHDQMIEIFRAMVRFQLLQEKNPRPEPRLI